jgi:glycosyltransferase involved in cell wall biosynthesis
MAPPYRIPVWNQIAELADLRVWLLENNDRLLSDGSNRGSDWADSRGREFEVEELTTSVLRRGEARHYVKWWLPKSRFRDVDAVLIGGWDSPAYWLAAWSARRSGARVVGFYESHAGSREHENGLLHKLRHRFFMSLDAVVVPGVATEETLIADGIPRERIWVGFNAVDVSEIASRTLAARAHLIPTSSLRLLFIGQLIERKNIDSLLRALSISKITASTLTLIGVGDEEQSLRDLATHLDLSDRISFLGHVANADLPDVFAKHDILVLPSRSEVWGLVVNEALAAGLSVIVSSTAGVSASVAGMPGVSLTGQTPEEIAEVLDAAWDDFDGPVSQPEILMHTPEAFANVFLAALSDSKSAID